MKICYNIMVRRKEKLNKDLINQIEQVRNSICICENNMNFVTGDVHELYMYELAFLEKRYIYLMKELKANNETKKL